MKLLLDECTPKRLKHDFEGHEVRTVHDVGLQGVLNGELLSAAVAQQFDVLVTVDRRIPFQQNISQFNLALLVLVVRPCRYPQLKLLVPRALETIKSGESLVIHWLAGQAYVEYHG